MHTLQGIISKSVNNMETQLERLDYISSNFSNVNTNGHKSVHFEQIMQENGYLTGIVRTDFSTGKLFKTSKELDVAIDGYGFIPVTTANGEIAYTRDGSFRVGKDGYLFNMRGDLVGDGIQVPVNVRKIQITSNGDINVSYNNAEKPKKIGKIPLVYFNNPEGLQAIDGNKYVATETSGEPILEKQHTNFKQGFVEYSNTDLYDEAFTVMRLNTSTLAANQMIKVVNDMYQKGLQITES